MACMCVRGRPHQPQGSGTAIQCAVCGTAAVAVCLQMNVWQAIFGFIGNYFWTHYFFNLLGAAYTLPSHKLNGVRPVEWQEGVHHTTLVLSARDTQPISKHHSLVPVGRLLVSVAAGCADEQALCWVCAPCVLCAAGASGDVPHDTCVLLLLPCHIKPGPAQGRD